MCITCVKQPVTIEKNQQQIWINFQCQKKKSDILRLHEKGELYFRNDKAKNRYKFCSLNPVFWIYQDSEKNIYKKLLWWSWYYCQDKLCPHCTKRILYNKRKKIMEFLEKRTDLVKKNWYYLVLTCKHNKDDSLSDVWEKLQRSKKTLSNISRKDKLRIKENKEIKSFLGSFDGVYWTIETTKTNNWWNVHINILWCTDHEIALETITVKDTTRGALPGATKQVSISKQLVSEWERITKDSKMISVSKLDFSETQSKKDAIQEVFKYSMKDDSMWAKEKIEFANFTRWKRMNWGWGVLQSMLSDKDSDFINYNDDMEDIIDNETKENQEETKVINWDKLNYIWTVHYSFWWNGKNVVYKKTTTCLLDPGINENDLWLPDEYIYTMNKDNKSWEVTTR